LDNYYDQNTVLLKINIIDKKIDNIAFINFQKHVRIICAYDMDVDGFLDILYIDDKNNLYILYNDDPNYLNVFVTSLNTILINQQPRLFIIDSDRDGYPDIVTADKGQNTIGLFFNQGKGYWNDIKQFFKENQFNKDLIYKQKSWRFIPLIDIYEEKLTGQILRDFTILKLKHGEKKRLDFQIFALYDSNPYWFIEKEIAGDTSIQDLKKIEQNYFYMMTKGVIVLDHLDDVHSGDYNMIIDIDINNDTYPEFILYSIKNAKLYWMKKYVAYITGFGWDSNFWILLTIYIYIVSSVIGFYQFYKLKLLNDQIVNDKLVNVYSNH
jgi:hypothetical protein